ncbi:MAG: hypothetical protein KF802_09385 [Bdellovibrionaceae bacterium]|nr:hypothetical protein [Pseudobdellovibrionaceae bacterium]MBX3033671.1 hypothetical protein [Pseudobdellovibrionaceae bacterium]
MSRKTKRIAVLFALLLTLIVMGASVFRYFNPVPFQDANRILDEALQKAPAGHFQFEFEETRDFPAGAGLSQWLEDFPDPRRVRAVQLNYKALYSLDGAGGDWDIGVPPEDSNALVVKMPMPEFKGFQFSPASLKIEATPPLSKEDHQLAEEILEDKILPLARQEENSKRLQRLEACKDKVREFIVEVFRRHHLTPPQKIEVLLANEGVVPEEGP